MRESTLSLASAFEESQVYIKNLFRRAKALHALNKPFEALGRSTHSFKSLMFCSCKALISSLSGDIVMCLVDKPNDETFKAFHEELIEDFKSLPGLFNYTVMYSL